MRCCPLRRFTQFKLEGGSCQYDSLTIFDGPSTTSPQLARLCGDSLPQPILSTGNSMMLVFRTDGSVAYDGFHAVYRESFGTKY